MKKKEKLFNANNVGKKIRNKYFYITSLVRNIFTYYNIPYKNVTSDKYIDNSVNTTLSYNYDTSILELYNRKKIDYDTDTLHQITQS